ncbi:MAG TPA: type II toxin-antitoxin system RatA family toxin [Burkholderiales bacterium]|nr:type II toxin-antitoxin system RatA family toxin [Burkholderiales bacterium]
MKSIERGALVQHSAQQMYSLVEDIESYPKFLPWCSRTEIHRRDESITVATIHIAYAGVQQQFTTENLKQPGTAMTIRLVKGLFKHLNGDWLFKPLGPDACKVELRLSYQMSSGFLETLAGPVFNHIANTLVDAFVARADAVRAGAK